MNRGDLEAVTSLGDELPVQWLDDAALEAALRAELDRFELDGDAVLGALGEGDRYRCIAKGPDVLIERPRATQGNDARQATFFWHDTTTDRIALAMNAATMPDLWIDAEPTPAGLRSLWQALFGNGSPASPRTFRFFLGPLQERDFMDLENGLTLSPFTEGLPLRLGTAANLRANDEVVHSIFQTLYGRATLTTVLMDQVFGDDSGAYGVLEYTPKTAASVVEAWNAKYDTSWPLDVPVDVLPSLSGNLVWSLERIEALLDEEPRLELVTLGALLIDGPGPGAGGTEEAEAFFRRHQRSKDAAVRAQVGALAFNFGLGALIDQMIEQEAEEDVRAYLREVAATV